MAVPSQRRHRSRQQLLEVIRREAGVTRADLGRITGLSRSAITEAVQDLMADRLVVEDVLDPGGDGAGRGRPSALLIVAPPSGIVVGIDFARGRVSVAVATTQGQVLAEQRSAVHASGEPQGAMDVAAGATHRLLGQLGMSIADVSSVVAGIPAPLDVRTRRIRTRPIVSKWSTLDPEHELSQRLSCEVVAANDADLGAEGELRFGAAKGYRDVVYVKAGDGIGAGLILNGAVYEGSQGLAGEFGHSRVIDGGPWCRCGGRGCLESVVSSSLVHNRLRQSGIDIGSDRDFPLAPCREHPYVSRFVVELGRMLGQVLADVCNTLNPAAVILGGELGTAGRPLVDGVREALRTDAQPEIAECLEVRPAQLGLRAELMGALAHAGRRALYLNAPC